jgi:hypothetical protein
MPSIQDMFIRIGSDQWCRKIYSAGKLKLKIGTLRPRHRAWHQIFQARLNSRQAIAISCNHSRICLDQCHAPDTHRPRSDYICGDTLNLACDSDKWPGSATGGVDIESMSTTAARLLDERAGKTYRIYDFASFVPVGNSSGYDIYLCNGQGNRAIPPISGVSDDAGLMGAILTSCFYVGYVLSTLLII